MHTVLSLALAHARCFKGFDQHGISVANSKRGHVKQRTKVRNLLQSDLHMIEFRALQQKCTDKSSGHPLCALCGQGRGLCFLKSRSGWDDEEFPGDDIVRLYKAYKH